jgi:hypothetical protein
MTWTDRFDRLVKAMASGEPPKRPKRDQKPEKPEKPKG